MHLSSQILNVTSPTKRSRGMSKLQQTIRIDHLSPKILEGHTLKHVAIYAGAELPTNTPPQHYALTPGI